MAFFSRSKTPPAPPAPVPPVSIPTDVATDVAADRGRAITPPRPCGRTSHPGDRRGVPRAGPGRQGRTAQRRVLVRQAHGLGDAGRGVQGPAVPVRRRLSDASDARPDPRPSRRLPLPARRHPPARNGPRGQGRRRREDHVREDDGEADHRHGGEVHRRHRRRGCAPDASEALEAGPRVQRRSPRRGVRLRQGGRGLPGEVHGSHREPPGCGRRVAGERATGARPSRRGPPHQRLDQDQLALRQDGSDRHRRIDRRPGRSPAAPCS